VQRVHLVIVPHERYPGFHLSDSTRCLWWHSQVFTFVYQPQEARRYHAQFFTVLR
jgi:hypothetical protein